MSDSCELCLGCDVETISVIANSQGLSVLTLWHKLLRYHRNGFILGACSRPESLSDSELRDRGILFDSTYTLYDIKEVDGIRLLLVRNPAGNHKEWDGDWSDESKLWTHRLKYKLKYIKENDNLFWVEMNDFCNIFRFIYVCKWFDYRSHWKALMFRGQWIRFLKIEDTPIVKDEDDDLNESSTESQCKPNDYGTCGGLPSSQEGAECSPENNPYYSLEIFNFTELHASLRQTKNESEECPLIIHPAGIYILRNDDTLEFHRHKVLSGESLIAGSGIARSDILISLEAFLPPGRYVILIALLRLGLEGNFELSLRSDQEIASSQIWPPPMIDIPHNYSEKA
jgi:hypothetical protein